MNFQAVRPSGTATSSCIQVLENPMISDSPECINFKSEFCHTTSLLHQFLKEHCVLWRCCDRCVTCATLFIQNYQDFLPHLGTKHFGSGHALAEEGRLSILFMSKT